MEFRDTLHIQYRVKSLGKPTTYLSWTIKRTGTGSIHPSRPTLITKELGCSCLTESNTHLSPLSKQPDFDVAVSASPLTESDMLIYQYLLGDLRYLSDCTRTDIGFATSRCAHYSHSPTTTHIHRTPQTIAPLP